MKIIPIGLYLFSFVLLYMQRNIKGLIHAEESFAAYSVALGTKEAFLHFLDSTAIIFQQGKPVNGVAAWRQREQTSGTLNWHPQFAEIAKSGDFGYTTDPWTFQPKGTMDTVAARGQYITVWHINKNNKWKALIDAGVNYTLVNKVRHTSIVKASTRKTAANDSASLLQAERAFISAFTENRMAAYNHFLSNTSILNRNKQLPAVRKADQKSLIQDMPATLQFTLLGSAIAVSGDLGYVYGTGILNEEQDGYLHICRREKTGWKIALEVVRF